MADPDSTDTTAIHDQLGWPHGDVVPPIHLSSTYERPGIDPETSLSDVDPEAGEFLYGRLSNPTRHAVERQLATLAGGDHGFAVASGTAAIVTAVLSVVEAGDHLVAAEDLYTGTQQLLDDLVADRMGVDVEYVDGTDPDAVADAVTDDTAMVWMETPTNPLIRLCDIEAISAIAAEADAVFGVDNTFASPYFQRPLDLGADLVVHSTTKYLNGHSDGVGGAIITDDADLADTIGFYQQTVLGNPMPPFDAYLLARGLETLSLRMRQHEANATVLAEYLDEHPMVRSVSYPGLESHPQHDLAAAQMDGYGGVLSFELDGGTPEVTRFCEALETMTLAVSLGGVETLVNHPATMTHEPLGADRRAEIGISDGLIRLSVGIEEIDALRADLDRGFAAIEGARTTQR